MVATYESPGSGDKDRRWSARGQADGPIRALVGTADQIRSAPARVGCRRSFSTPSGPLWLSFARLAHHRYGLTRRVGFLTWTGVWALSWARRVVRAGRGSGLSVTELHLMPDDRRPGDPSLPTDLLEVHPLEVHPLDAEARQTPSIAVLILDHAPDPREVSHLYEDFQIVLIAHDTASAVTMLQGMATSEAPAPVTVVTPLFDNGFAHAVSGAAASGSPDEGSGLTFDASHYLATWQGRPLPLTYRERLILGCLLTDPGRVWSYGELFEHAWGGCYLGDPSLVHSALKRVRRKIREAGVSLTIDAVRGVGFRAEPAG